MSWISLEWFSRIEPAESYVRLHPDLNLKVVKKDKGSFLVMQDPKEYNRLLALPPMEMIRAYEMKTPKGGEE